MASSRMLIASVSAIFILVSLTLLRALRCTSERSPLETPIAVISSGGQTLDGATVAGVLPEGRAHAGARAANTTDCVRCPVCLRKPSRGAAACLSASAHRIGPHPDITGEWGVPAREVWHCPESDAYFTHPTLSAAELDTLYTHHYADQNPSTKPRSVAQAAYIEGLAIGERKAHRLPSPATIVEMGCSTGRLLASFAAPGRTLVCFEPSEKHATEARERLSATDASAAHVVRGLFDPDSPLLRAGIDLFLSSHVLEHVPDVCAFLQTLYAKVRPGGLVFTEVPNHVDGAVRHDFKGLYHVSLPTPTSLHAYMQAAGFRLIDMQLVGKDERPRGHGFHLRSLYLRPRGELGQDLRPWQRGQKLIDGSFDRGRAPARSLPPLRSRSLQSA